MSTNTLQVSTRVRAAILAHKAEHQFARMSVSGICRAAGVSRANLYENHPELVIEILQWGSKNIIARGAKVTRTGRLEAAIREKKELQERFDAILMICVELQAEVRTLRSNAARAAKRKS